MSPRRVDFFINSGSVFFFFLPEDLFIYRLISVDEVCGLLRSIIHHRCDFCHPGSLPFPYWTAKGFIEFIKA